jgi:hypothetical protein
MAWGPSVLMAGVHFGLVNFILVSLSNRYASSTTFFFRRARRSTAVCFASRIHTLIGFV